MNMDSDVVFSVNQINKNIKKEYTSLRNRIQSILLDHTFIAEKVIPRFPNYPLIPNERCGLWYCNPDHFSKTSYFKSTDGHTNQWDFSTRRLNLHLISILQEKSGIIIVDSTRRGKLMPDALSKTIPIWCAVLNSFLYPGDDEVLFTPPTCVSKSEHDSIKKRIPELVDRLKKLNILKEDDLRNKLHGKFLRPFWVYPGSDLLQSSTDPFTGEIIETQWEPDPSERIIPIILCTASYKAQDGVDKRYGFTYVQGAADDHELWSCGLDPKMLWSHWDYFYDPKHDETELESHVKIFRETREISDHRSQLRNVLDINSITKELSLGQLKENVILSPELVKELKSRFSLMIIFSSSVLLSEPQDFIRIYKLQSGSKRSSKDLRTVLVDIDRIISTQLSKPIIQEKPIMICCNSGIDISVGAILVILCKYYSEDWSLGKSDSVNKLVIRRHLVKIINKVHQRNINPSRATLNSVNSFLM